MVIEFIGAPGAGKTTFLPTVTGFFQEQGQTAFTVVDAARPFAKRTVAGKVINRLTPQSMRAPLLWQLFYRLSTVYRLKFIARHFKLVQQVRDSQKHRPEAADARERKVLYWYYHLMGYYEFLCAHAQEDDVLILDEGFLHRVVQLFSSIVEAPDPAQIAAYVELLPKPDLLIYVQAPIETCEQRIYSRGLWERFQHKTPQEISQFVVNAHKAVELTIDQIKNKGWTVIELDNGHDDLLATKAELRRQLEQSLTSSSAKEMPSYQFNEIGRSLAK